MANREDDGMKYNRLGRTELSVSCCGLGGGGLSCLGMNQHASPEKAVPLVRAAHDAGINLFDTSERNGTQIVIGAALKEIDRSQVIISSKHSVSRGDRRYGPKDITAGIDQALRELNTDYIDIYSFHGVLPEEYGFVESELLPCLLDARAAGKIRYVGMTEAFARDPHHRSLAAAVKSSHWDVVMAGYNMLSQAADESVFKPARDNDIGVLAMFAFRHNRRSFHDILSERNLDGQADAEGYRLQGARLRQILAGIGTMEPCELAYRFLAANRLIDCTLIGTGNRDHLMANVRCFDQPHLDPRDIERIKSLAR